MIDYMIVYVEQQECATCGVAFGISRHLLARRRKDGASFFCPNGHSQCYALTPEQEKIGRLEADALKLKADIKKLRHFLLAGRCPVCDRVMSNLTMHLHKSHFPLVQEWEKEAAK